MITLAHQIRQGQTEELDCHGDVAFFPVGLYEIKDQVINVVQSALNKGYDIQDIQVLASKIQRTGRNRPAERRFAAMPESAGAGQARMEGGYRTFREGDKILQLKTSRMTTSTTAISACLWKSFTPMRTKPARTG